MNYANWMSAEGIVRFEIGALDPATWLVTAVMTSGLRRQSMFIDAPGWDDGPSVAGRSYRFRSVGHTSNIGMAGGERVELGTLAFPGLTDGELVQGGTIGTVCAAFFEQRGIRKLRLLHDE